MFCLQHCGVFVDLLVSDTRREARTVARYRWITPAQSLMQLRQLCNSAPSLLWGVPVILSTPSSYKNRERERMAFVLSVRWNNNSLQTWTHTCIYACGPSVTWCVIHTAVKVSHTLRKQWFEVKGIPLKWCKSVKQVRKKLFNVCVHGHVWG